MTIAWQIAAYAIALAVTVSAGVMALALFRVYRSFRRWDRMAVRFALKADNALDECVRTAREARETAEMCRSTLSGFAKVAEAARTVGEIADSAAQTAANIAALWREKLSAESFEEHAGPAGLVFDWAEFGRLLGLHIRRRIFGHDGVPSGTFPGKNADPIEGE